MATRRVRKRGADAVAWRGAAAAVLEPLVGALLAQGLRARDISDLVGQVVAAARRPRSAHCSIRSESREFTYPMGTRLLSRWISDEPYGSNGHAHDLPLEGPTSFASLAKSAGCDATVARRALERLGLVRVSGERVTLLADAYVPSSGVVEKLDILGRDGAELLRLMIRNVSSGRSRARLQRKASYDNIGSAALPALEAALREQGMVALRRANELLLAADRDRNPSAPGGARTRVSFGVYLAAEPAGAARGETGSRARRRSR